MNQSFRNALDQIYVGQLFDWLLTCSTIFDHKPTFNWIDRHRVLENYLKINRSFDRQAAGMNLFDEMGRPSREVFSEGAVS